MQKETRFGKEDSQKVEIWKKEEGKIETMIENLGFGMNEILGN